MHLSPLSTLILFVGSSGLPLVSAEQPPIFINAGSDKSYRDGNGNTWMADDYYYQGETWENITAIANTNSDPLFRTERWSKPGDSRMRYDIPVESGVYDIRLHFAENYGRAQGNGKRVFHVLVDGIMAMPNVDIYKLAGGKGSFATNEVFRTTVVGPFLSLEFVHVTDNPKVNAIEIRQTKSEDIHEDIRNVIPVIGGEEPQAKSWFDSYSVGDRCYCDSTFDHNIGEILVETSIGWMTVKQACTLLGPGPGRNGRPVYNDIQCGNGPPNNAGDEHTCPGRVDMGEKGCGHIGPKWNFGDFVSNTMPAWATTRDFIDAGGPFDSGARFPDAWTYTAMDSVDVVGTAAIPAYIFRTHESSGMLKYTVGGFTPKKMYRVSMGFAEIYEPSCESGKRLMKVQINGAVYEDSLDVFDEAKKTCGKGIVKSYNVKAHNDGMFKISFESVKENAMVSFIEIVEVCG